ncbi:sigma 54-interacting transcriptional regulator [Croceibacter atlanticus]|uniref:sigma 54-interacting transcriptional regulator n=1 Tax=Croceibacter atlanticus TaxID=313588 RepID=UPI0030F870B8
MSKENITTLGQLKASGYKSKSIKDELRDNLITNIKAGKNSFEGIHGYEYTVIPELERAILSKHNINLLGLRGQAKTRLARLMVGLLDEFIPVVEGSEINDDPFNPISRTAVELIAEKGDDTPVTWLHRDERFAEKLATPDVTVADLIGDVDPIKAANLKLSYADDRVIHFGMIPRANRCIFVINELPDLQARIQVALFNILQEGDIQIRGFKLRMPLDVQFVFTANPEDYTNRGSIVTPLKDRIGSQILTHYPETVEIAKTITQQEAKADVRKDTVHVPEIAKNLLEELSFQARESEFVDIKSGISARMSITAYENLLSTAERRMLLSGDDTTAIRFSDFMGVIPSITGKIELVYEGEQEGSAAVAMQLLSRATKQIFIEYFPKIEKLQKADDVDPYQNLVEWFFEESKFELLDNFANDEYKSQLDSIQPLQALIENHIDDDVNEDDLYFIKELVLWALVEYNKLSKYRMTNGMRFKDIYGGYISGL